CHRRVDRDPRPPRLDRLPRVPPPVDRGGGHYSGGDRGDRALPAQADLGWPPGALRTDGAPPRLVPDPRGRGREAPRPRGQPSPRAVRGRRRPGDPGAHPLHRRLYDHPLRPRGGGEWRIATMNRWAPLLLTATALVAACAAGSATASPPAAPVA